MSGDAPGLYDLPEEEATRVCHLDNAGTSYLPRRLQYRRRLHLEDKGRIAVVVAAAAAERMIGMGSDMTGRLEESGVVVGAGGPGVGGDENAAGIPVAATNPP